MSARNTTTATTSIADLATDTTRWPTLRDLVLSGQASSGEVFDLYAKHPGFARWMRACNDDPAATVPLPDTTE